MPKNSSGGAPARPKSTSSRNSQLQKNKGSRFSPYNGGRPGQSKASAPTPSKRKPGNNERLKEELETSVDLVGLYQLVEGKKDPSKSDKAGMPRGNSLSIAAEAAQLQKEQKAKKEFDGSIDNALESLTKMAAS